MRVIKKDEKEYKHKCPFCKTIFAYKKRELKYDLWGSPYISCLECNEKISMTFNFLDKKVREEGGENNGN